MRQHTQLRLRIAASYVAFAAVLLAVIGLLFSQHLKHEAELNARTLVEADWGATMGFLHFHNERPEWFYDRNNSDEAYTVERLRHIYLLTNDAGVILENLAIFESIGFETPQTRASMRRILNTPARHAEYSIQRDRDGITYLIRAGLTRDDHDRRYLLAIGRSLALPYRSVDRFVETYALFAIAILFLTSLFTWWLTGIAIHRSQQTT